MRRSTRISYTRNHMIPKSWSIYNWAFRKLSIPLLDYSRSLYSLYNLMFYPWHQISYSSSVHIERQRCALWIRKLCEPSGTGAGLLGRKNRNLYAKLLLHMLRRGVLEGPFTHRPESGTLKTLPSYMVSTIGYCRAVSFP